MTQYREIEIKLYVKDLAEIERRLQLQGARLVSPRILERNNRYDNAERHLMEREQVLRLRQDTRARLTYKEENGVVVGKSGSRSRFEAEVEVSDFDAMHMILLKLGYTPFMVYEKYRTTYELHDAEITLDELPYGNFVEIEGEEHDISTVINALGLHDAPSLSKGYATLFEYVRHNLGLKFNDLTFENFAGISVPLSAFKP